MNTATSISFDDAVPSAVPIPDITFEPAAAARPAQTPVPTMPESLWHHTLQEHSADRRYRIISRTIFAIISVLGAASVAYAFWQTQLLMADNHLENAISVLMR